MLVLTLSYTGGTGGILTRCSTGSELSSSTWQMPFRAPFGTDVYVRNRLRIADSIPPLAGTDSFLGTADLEIDPVVWYLQVRTFQNTRIYDIRIISYNLGL